MISIGDGSVERIEVKDDLVTLYQADEVIGYNIFNTSLFANENDGFIAVTPQVLNELNAFLVEYGCDELIYDGDEFLHVAKVLEVAPIEGADTLHMCQVQTKSATYDIVCGAANVKEGMKTIVALDQAVLYDGTLITEGEVFGNHSKGMLCSAKELGLLDVKQQSGIIELNDNLDVGIGFSQIDWSDY